ncbi:hypothetical protein [Deefgea piscis]|uniref:hypothetical protein n=1 Tax=Deefgea piscis TaxID=2739061 RepID=UPI001C7FDD81|nr:hypothetical protein [Deefgea piscis]QZA80102.1 hypothetical protein K4H25_11185 [Deefgea piscis]
MQKKAGEKMAENDFKDIGLKNVMSKSISALLYLVKIVKHTKRVKNWDVEKIEPTLSEDFVVIVNNENKELMVPYAYYEWFQHLPQKSLNKMVSVIEENRVLTIGVYGDSPDQVSVDNTEKIYFDQSLEVDEDEEFLFPEFVQGDNVLLEGKLIRGSEKTNSLGLEYKGHIINCVPVVGNVRQFKSALFLRCRVVGIISRHIKEKFVAEKRPTLIIHEVIPLESDEQSIFNFT